MRTGKPKVVLVGDSSVGKTSMVNFLKSGCYINDSRATTAAMYFQYQSNEIQGRAIDIWDTAGMEQYQSLNSIYYEKASGVILACDLCKKRSLEKLNQYYEDISNHARGTPLFILVGCKNDLKKGHEVSQTDLMNWATEHGCRWFVTSSLTGENIVELFEYVVANTPENEQSLSTIILEEKHYEVEHCC